MAEKNKKQNNRLAEDDQSFKEKLEKEKLIDNVPDEEMRQKLAHDEKKHKKSKNDSLTEEEFDEDMKPDQKD
ncbi:hypothetical protein JF544_11885 [Halobacillus kuroshimensis]|uniref:YfhD family protein n=1 Tax=Halobacillus kuroshimensis TaxID=302481 RepID=A0ABS3DXA5_9BACI|nr:MULTISPECIES: hypothetical protein [Halobacillus]MBN8235956.1 hypothetical protein [Halobacillus kuroshimensis]